MSSYIVKKKRWVGVKDDFGESRRLMVDAKESVSNVKVSVYFSQAEQTESFPWDMVPIKYHDKELYSWVLQIDDVPVGLIDAGSLIQPLLRIWIAVRKLHKDGKASQFRNYTRLYKQASKRTLE